MSLNNEGQHKKINVKVFVKLFGQKSKKIINEPWEYSIDKILEVKPVRNQQTRNRILDKIYLHQRVCQMSKGSFGIITDLIDDGSRKPEKKKSL